MHIKSIEFSHISPPPYEIALRLNRKVNTFAERLRFSAIIKKKHVWKAKNVWTRSIMIERSKGSTRFRMGWTKRWMKNQSHVIIIMNSIIKIKLKFIAEKSRCEHWTPENWTASNGFYLFFNSFHLRKIRFSQLNLDWPPCRKFKSSVGIFSLECVCLCARNTARKHFIHCALWRESAKRSIGNRFV